ncbi:MAG: hypothetical protein II007_02145 [Gammaproteobacteria bacterium]|nr:hypothetical protein [Gammaproteobacteria bacterium]
MNDPVKWTPSSDITVNPLAGFTTSPRRTALCAHRLNRTLFLVTPRPHRCLARLNHILCRLRLAQRPDINAKTLMLQQYIDTPAASRRETFAWLVSVLVRLLALMVVACDSKTSHTHEENAD